jgi:hypothetical protein
MSEVVPDSIQLAAIEPTPFHLNLSTRGMKTMHTTHHRFARGLLTSAMIAVGTLAAPIALADDTEELKTKFAASDTNADGKLTLDEAKAGGMRRIVRGFDRIDSDGDGFITVEQIEAMMKSR